MAIGGGDPVVQDGWSNADAVKDFLDAHPQGVRYEEGDLFVLPDIEQTYTVVGVRFFRQSGGPRLYLDFRATCAVDGCGEEFLVTRSLNEMRSSPHMTRCCPDHRGLWKTPMRDAWRTQEELKLLADAEETRMAIREERKRQAQRYGRWEQHVLSAARVYAALDDAVDFERIAMVAAGYEPERKVGGRDTRLQQARRALSGLIAKGVLKQTGQFHVDLANLPPE